MKKLIMSFILTLTSITASAEYIMTIPLEREGGGALPSGSINFVNEVKIPESWITIDPLYSEWEYSGQIYGCSNWLPETFTIDQGEVFTQTATDCSQEQSRSKQEREQETTTLAIRITGTPIKEVQIITTTSTREAIGNGDSVLLSGSLLVGRHVASSQYASVDQSGFIAMADGSHKGSISPKNFNGIYIDSIIENAPPNEWENKVIIQLIGQIAEIRKVKSISVNGVKYSLSQDGWIKNPFTTAIVGRFSGGTAPFRNSVGQTVSIKFYE